MVIVQKGFLITPFYPLYIFPISCVRVRQKDYCTNSIMSLKRELKHPNRKRNDHNLVSWATKKTKNCTTCLNNWKQQKRWDGQLSNNKSRAREKGHFHTQSWSHNSTKKISHKGQNSINQRVRIFGLLGFRFPSNFYLILSLTFCVCFFWKFGHAGPLWHAKQLA